jgi:hypothetical protein
VHKSAIYGLVSALILCSCGCAKKHASGEDIQSELKSIRSIAAETELFIHQVMDGRVSSAFAAAHFQYLKNQDRLLQKDLAAASRPDGDLVIRGARAQADALSQELGRLACSPIDGAEASLSHIDHTAMATPPLPNSPSIDVKISFKSLGVYTPEPSSSHVRMLK